MTEAQDTLAESITTGVDNTMLPPPSVQEHYNNVKKKYFLSLGVASPQVPEQFSTEESSQLHRKLRTKTEPVKTNSESIINFAEGLYIKDSKRERRSASTPIPIGTNNNAENIGGSVYLSTSFEEESDPDNDDVHSWRSAKVFHNIHIFL
jgi:hypothetical protein